MAEHDFRPPPVVLDAMRATIDRGDFGYHDLEDDVGAAFARWSGERYGWSPDPEFVHTCVDVLQGVTAAITALSGPGEGVILTPPIYHIFLPDLSYRPAAPARVAHAPRPRCRLDSRPRRP